MKFKTNIELRDEIPVDEIESLEAGYKNPIEIKNKDSEKHKTDISGIEFWIPVTIEDCEYYWVSHKGRVWNSNSGRLIGGGTDTCGYSRVSLNKKYRSTHRVVALAFIENPESLETVNHKNGVKGDNSINNLEWMSKSDNTKHAWDTGLVKKKNKITENQIEQVLELRKKGYAYQRIADEVGIYPSTAWAKCKEAGLEIVKITNKTIDEMISLRKQGSTYKEIGEIVGVGHNTAWKYCKEAGLK